MDVNPKYILKAAKAIGIIVTFTFGSLAISALSAPYIYAEMYGWLEPHTIISKNPIVLTRGRMIDDYWSVERLDAGTFAIGEPHYYQFNYSYLIVGKKRALLFDAGPGVRNLQALVSRLTPLPVTVLPSHLHYDHLGGVAAFGSIAVIDLPGTRADIYGGVFVPGRYEFLGMIDHLARPRFHVDQWILPGTWIDLGGRQLQLLSTPGHTPTSASLYDPDHRQFFVGDLIYPGPLYLQLPGASLSSYRATTAALLALLPGDTRIWAAHCCRTDEGIRAPRLAVKDIAALQLALSRLRGGQLTGQGFYPKSFPVDQQIRLLAGFPWNNR